MAESKPKVVSIKCRAVGAEGNCDEHRASVGPAVGRQERNAIVRDLFRRYRDSLLRYLRRLVSSDEDAEELLQETYERFLRSEKFDLLESSVRAYLFKTATNLATDHYRRQAVRQRDAYVAAHETDLVSEEPGPDRLAECNQALRIVKRGLLELSPRCRRVFLLHVAEHLSYREIAQRLEVSAKTVERDMVLALALLKERLRKWQ